ncbi:MAG: hypothetical protein II885_08825 [Oscillospiraceae bacterium]|nr:hypothetical protein [Oscillospiraceae bacterium]
MTKKKVLLFLQAALCLVLVGMLAAGVIGIYRQGIAEKQENPLAWVYTREKAAAALTPAVPVFLLAVAVTAACAALNVRDENADKPVKDLELSRNLMRARVAQPNDAMQKEQALQKKLLIGGWAGFGICMLPVGLYMINGSHFLNGDLDEMIGSLAVHVFPWIILGLMCLIVATLLQGKSIQRELDAIQARIKEEKAAGIKAEPKDIKTAPDYTKLRRLLLFLAVVFIVAGIFNGSMTAVINKAIRICTECVGLG